MLTVISPAKRLDLTPVDLSLATEPLFHKDAHTLVKAARKLTQADLRRLMSISEPLAKLNAERFKAFNLDGQSNSAKPAALTFDGDVYWGLEAKSMSDDELSYAQDHLRILSGLYGVLRPMDSMQAYRLEMGTKLATKRGKSLYDFWGTTIADTLNADMSDHNDKTIVNLASNEYFKAVDKKSISSPVITAKFLNVKDGQARALMYYAKFGRGLMARWIMQNRVDRAEGLKDFNLDGYKLDKKESSETELVFKRPQPAPKK